MNDETKRVRDNFLQSKKKILNNRGKKERGRLRVLL
jgi:hypothetical protein